MVFATTPANAQSSPISLTPAVVEAGSPVLIRVEAGDAAGVGGEWLGRKVDFFRGADGQTWFALAGVDVEALVGPSTLRIDVRLAEGGVRVLSRSVEIHPARYRTSSLTVAPKFIEPGPEALKQIEAESQLKAKVFAASALEPLWAGSFRAPVIAAPTDSFGTRRIFNGKLASIHKGMDFRAATGTPVRAGNRGVVVLARPLYYEGNCVIIDHGLGLFTLSMHMSPHRRTGGPARDKRRTAGAERRNWARDRTTSALGCPLAGRLSGPRQAAAAELEPGALVHKCGFCLSGCS